MCTGGSNYVIDNYTGPQYEYANVKVGEDSDGNPIYEEKIVAEHRILEYSGENLGLMAKPAFDLELGATITGLKATSSHGMLLRKDTADVGSNAQVRWETDDELLWGTVIDLEYSIEVKNTSASYQCNQLSLIAYLPDRFGLDENSGFITIDGNNKEYKWKEANLLELYNKGLISKDTYDAHSNQTAITATIDNNEKPYFYIPPGGSRAIKVVITSVASGDMDSYGDLKPFEVEVLSYRDNGKNTHRRIMTNSGTRRINGTQIPVMVGLFPGNNKEHDYSKEVTNSIYIGPPLGKKLKIYTGLTIFTICVTPLIVYETVIIVRKKRKKSKNLT